MERILLGVVANCLRTYAIFRFVRLLLPSKIKNKLLSIVVYTLFIILTSGGYYLFHTWYINIFTNILGLIFIVLMYQKNFFKDVLTIMCIYSVNIVIESLVFSVVGMYERSAAITESVNECITSIGILIFVVVLEKTKAVKQKEFKLTVSLWFGLISVPIISIIIILELLNFYTVHKKSIEIEITGILIINLVIFYLYGAIQDYYIQKIENEEFSKQIEIYGNQLNVMKNSYQKIRQLRHDMKHHLGELKYLANKEDKIQLLHYIDEMEKHMLNSEEYVSSGNQEIDGTLNYLLQTAKRTLKEVDVNVSIPEGLEIHNYMFNAMLGNLLENAIAAAVNTEKKYLKVHIKIKQSVLYINVENSFEGEVKVKNKKILSTKKDIKNHGIGLESVKKIVDEMNGIIDINWKDEIFCVNIMCYLSDIKAFCEKC